ncbi:MAG: hypothetical protein Q4C79_07635 [Neisseria sp.]|uniref:hypothetical protein n=1 Tax=Neisseria sp. TaxID=192066 RepID=UPI0026DA7A9B|nr:hypothetical protein [Neisseria sp.]MDO4248813.1 hypothetical protein [Neisseria sp.]
MSGKPVVLLAMPADNGIHSVIADALVHHGFNAVDIAQNPKTFRYPGLAARASVKFRQLVLRDKEAKKKLEASLYEAEMLEKLRRAGGADYALFIRGDIYPAGFLKKIRSQVRGLMVNYQWDGMNRFPAIWPCLTAFDRNYIFDPYDLNQAGHRFYPACNFYFDHLPCLSETPNDFYFVGGHVPERASLVAAFAQHARQAGWRLDFHIAWYPKDFHRARTVYPCDNINLMRDSWDFQTNLAHTMQAKVLVDFRNPVHNGLSFRAFEALGYGKKLITTNPNIRHYDFYHPDNILIWDGKTFDGMARFLERPYREPDPEIKRKYGFGNWIRYILNIRPHQKITLPQA